MKEKHILLIDNKVRNHKFNKNDIIIRWGNRIHIESNGAKVINLSKGIANASNKAKARQIFQENNISCPKTWINEEILDYTFPLICRPYFHRKGQNFNIINNIDQLEHLWSQTDEETSLYYSKIIDKSNEYRVHVGHGKVLLIHEKPLKEGEIRGNQAITGLSWGNVLNWSEYKQKLCKLACDGVKVLGLSTGAVDIIKGKDKKYYILEVNTAPTLNDSPYSCQRYAKYFDWILKHPKNKWWDYNKYTLGKSFAWTNTQLGE
jgi:glutathione synthase/RimK-type ligase-like ATP-grasp enzyme